MEIHTLAKGKSELQFAMENASKLATLERWLLRFGGAHCVNIDFAHDKGL